MLRPSHGGRFRMPTISSLADELRRRQQIRGRIDDGQLILDLNGQTVTLTPDEEHDRFVLWGELAQLGDDDLSPAARLSLQFNDEFAYPRALTLGVSSGARCAILGRSFDAPDLESGRLLREAQEFGCELAAAKAWFAERLAGAKAPASGAGAPAPPGENFIRI